MTFKESIQTCFSKYVTFSGRAQRSEFWWFVLFNFVCQFVLLFVDGALFGVDAEGEVVPVLGAIFSLAVFLPGLSVGVRRLHDTGRSGWWYWIILVPILGFLVLLYFWVSKGTDGTNQFGEVRWADAAQQAPQ